MSRSGWLTGIFHKVLHNGLNPSFSGCPALGEPSLPIDVIFYGLNPSFSGCPALGHNFSWLILYCIVLIPLLVDVPLWENEVGWIRR